MKAFFDLTNKRKDPKAKERETTNQIKAAVYGYKWVHEVVPKELLFEQNSLKEHYVSHLLTERISDYIEITGRPAP